MVSANDAATQDISSEGVAAEELKQFVERAERVQEDIDASRGDLKDIKAELRGRGFDVKAFNAILRIRKKDHAERQEEEAVLDLYKQALGLV